VQLGRVGEPADVAEAIASLAGMSHVTEQVLRIDGGQLPAR
jgi:NAD(P)-dependent dehydrogenase (short-subunit alcohol dehydrogenase family)